jgi:flagellar motor protein MotB
MKFKNKPSDDGGDDWLTTYSDLVTLLLAFFVLLFSFSEVDATKWQELVQSFSGDIVILEEGSTSSIIDSDSSVFEDSNKSSEDDSTEDLEDEGNTDPEGENAAVVDENENTDISESDTSYENENSEGNEDNEAGSEEDNLGTVDEEDLEDEAAVLEPEENIDDTAGIDTSDEEREETSGNVYNDKFVNEQFDELYSSLMFFNDNEGLKMEITKSESEIKIRLSNNMLFGPEKADINEASHKALKEVVEIVKEYDEVIEKMIMEGNTDNLPIRSSNYRDNFELSLERALNVLYFFKYEGNFNPQKLVPMGYGEYNPVATNDTVEGRAKNRRTDVILVKHLQEQ